MSPLKVGVIGAGHLGRIHTKLIQQVSGAELVAVAEPSQPSQKMVAELTAAEIVTDYRELVGKIDAAIVATPTASHFEICAFLIQNGIHVLVEKPVTDSVADAKALVDLADRHRTVVAVGHCERFNAAIQTAVAEIGQPKFIQAARMSTYTYRSTDIGVVHDLMIHDIDLVNSLFQGTPVDVRANGISVFGGKEDISQARIQFSCGGVANLTASRASFHAERSLKIFGTEGFASVDLASHTVDYVRIPSWVRNREINFADVTQDQMQFVKENLFSQILPHQKTEVEPVNAILIEQQDWVEAIRFGGTPRTTLVSGSQAVEIAQSVLDSVAAHNWSSNAPGMAGPYATPMVNDPRPDPIPAELMSMMLTFRKAG